MVGFKNNFNYSKKGLVCFLLASIVCAAIVAYAMHCLRMAQEQRDLARARSMTIAGLQTDIQYLKKNGDEIGSDVQLRAALEQSDVQLLGAILDKERKDHGIGLMGITDANGIIVSRTKTKNYTGDNAFLQTAQGRALLGQDSVESIEISGINPAQLLMTTGRKIKNGDKLIGALFANYLLDDAYAKRFATAYLPEKTEVVFYTKKYGLYGSSFQDVGQKNILAFYVSPESEWVKHGVSGQRVVLGNRQYQVENIIFPGLEKSPGGVLVFMPIDWYFWVWAGVVAVDLFVLVFLGLCLHYTTIKKREKRSRVWQSILLASAALVAAAIAIIEVRLLYPAAQILHQQTLPLYNSILRFQPESAVFPIKKEARLPVVIDTGSESINAIELHIHYNAQQIKVKEIDTAKSVCKNIINTQIDDVKGIATVECIIPSPGFSGNAAEVASMVVEPQKEGEFAVVFDIDQTQVLANDGLATNVLRVAHGGSFIAADYEKAGEQKPLVYSPTNPNSSAWYNNEDVQFVWPAESVSTTYLYRLDKNPLGIPEPTESAILKKNTLQLKIPSSGRWYFHLARQGWKNKNEIAHFGFNVDIDPPEQVSLQVSTDRPNIGDTVRVKVSGVDEASGIQPIYYVKFGGELFLPAQSVFYIPVKDEGV